MYIKSLKTTIETDKKIQVSHSKFHEVMMQKYELIFFYYLWGRGTPQENQCRFGTKGFKGALCRVPLSPEAQHTRTTNDEEMSSLQFPELASRRKKKLGFFFSRKYHHKHSSLRDC